MNVYELMKGYRKIIWIQVIIIWAMASSIMEFPIWTTLLLFGVVFVMTLEGCAWYYKMQHPTDNTTIKTV